MAYPYVGSGLAGQVVYAAESTYGVSQLSTHVMPLEVLSESNELKKNVVQGKGLHAGGFYDRSPRRKISHWSTAGGIKMEVPTNGLNQLLWAMIGSKANGTLVADSTVYQATHAPGTLTGTSLTIQKGVPTVDGTAAVPLTYTGQKLADWELSVAVGAIANLDLTLLGRSELAAQNRNPDPLNASVPGLYAFPAETAPSDVFFFREATITMGGTPSTTAGVTTVSGGTSLGNVTKASVKQAMKYDAARVFMGSGGYIAEPIENDWRSGSGSLEIEWNQAAIASGGVYDAFQGDTQVCMVISLVGLSTIATSIYPTLTFILPAVKLDGESPKLNGPAVVKQAVPFTFLDDTTDNPIQINYITTDSF
jgi:Phage tail tube protein